MKNKTIKKIFVLSIISLLISLNFLSTSSADKSSFEIINNKKSCINGNCLDVGYIYNITERLSNIVFTEYNESGGELAKGRWFGTNGEHKAAEILYENMTKLGLYTTLEQIKNIDNVVNPYLSKLTKDIEILDFGLKINGEAINDFHICSVSKGPREKPEQIDYNFSYEGLKVIKKPKIVFPWMYRKTFSNDGKDFVFIEQVTAFNPDLWPPVKQFLSKFINPVRRPLLFYHKLLNKFQSNEWYYTIPGLKAIIKYDFNKDAYNLGASKEIIPIIYVNGTVGQMILDNIDNFTIDFYLNQRKNDSLISYNVIGQLNGTDPTKTVIVDCLYDSWWCQGTADSAIGMAMVLGVAKYFKEHNIIPKYNMKFIGFSGEENGLRGVKYYEATHRAEKIIYVIDLNQIGFKQDGERLKLNIICNKVPFLKEIWNVVKKTDYVSRVNNTADIGPLWMPPGAPSDDQMFAIKRPLCKTVCFLKDTCWYFHHRDGLNHSEGDVLKYFDWDDVSATGEIVLNVTKYLTC